MYLSQGEIVQVFEAFSHPWVMYERRIGAACLPWGDEEEVHWEAQVLLSPPIQTDLCVIQ